MHIPDMLNIIGRRQKGLLSLDHYNWFEIDFEIVKDRAKDIGYTYYKYDVSAALSHSCSKKACNDVINVDAAIKYMVCNELELMHHQVNLTKEDHLRVTEKWRSIARSCIDYTLAAIRENNITKILFPQGYVIEAAVCRIVAAKFGLSILSIENSLHKDRLLWDNLSGITVNFNLCKNYFWKYQENIDQNSADDFVSGYLGSIKQNKSPEHSSPGKELNITGRKKTILFLGQVYVDSSVLFNLYDYADSVEIIETLCEYCTKNDYNLIVKLHPKEISGNSIVNKPLDKITWRKLLSSEIFSNKYQYSSNIVVDNNNSYDTYSLISSSDVCVTINSMAGLEACLMEKSVINCGYSCYTGLGFTYEARERDLLLYYLDKILKQDKPHIKNKIANVFFYIFSKLFCMERTESALMNALKTR